jgi:hypothetical protein
MKIESADLKIENIFSKKKYTMYKNSKSELKKILKSNQGTDDDIKYRTD